MTKIYRLTIDDEQIYDIYYSENLAIDNAMLVSMDKEETVVVWEAEIPDNAPIEKIDFDDLDWEKHWTAWV